MFKIKINSQNYTDILSKGLKLPRQQNANTYYHMFQFIIHVYIYIYIYRCMCLFDVLRAKHCGHVDDKVIGEACLERQIRIRLRGISGDYCACDRIGSGLR